MVVSLMLVCSSSCSGKGSNFTSPPESLSHVSVAKVLILYPSGSVSIVSLLQGANAKVQLSYPLGSLSGAFGRRTCAARAPSFAVTVTVTVVTTAATEQCYVSLGKDGAVHKWIGCDSCERWAHLKCVHLGVVKVEGIVHIQYTGSVHLVI